jgi:group I intron endonuclease
VTDSKAAEGKNYYLYFYSHHNSGKKYIGITCDPKRRFKKHAKANSDAESFNRAVKKYGIDAFDHKIIGIFHNIKEAERGENFAIKYFGTLSPGGYNLCGGAPASIYLGNLSKETKTKIRNRMLGRICPAERRIKISNSLKGRPLTPEHCSRMIEAQRSLFVRTKISNACKGKKKIFSAAHRNALSLAIKRYWAEKRKS